MKARSKTSLRAHSDDLFGEYSPEQLAAEAPTVANESAEIQPDVTQRPAIPHRAAMGAKKLLPRSTEDLTPGNAKVRLNVARLPDDRLIMTCKAHLLATEDNPLFADLQPGNEAYQGLIDDFRSSVSEIANLKLALEAAYGRRDQKRDALEHGTRMRISGVQLISKGDSSGIAAAGLATQKKPEPIGTLSAPTGLLVTLGQNPGTMELTWDAVKKTRGYLLQYAEGKMGDPNPIWTLIVSHKPKYILTSMNPGTSYLFRVATIGGKGGQSAWSPTVVRVAG